MVGIASFYQVGIKKSEFGANFACLGLAKVIGLFACMSVLYIMYVAHTSAVEMSCAVASAASASGSALPDHELSPAPFSVRPQGPHYNEQTAGFIKVLSWPNLPPYKISYITRLCFWQNLSTLLSSEVDVITPL